MKRFSFMRPVALILLPALLLSGCSESRDGEPSPASALLRIEIAPSAAVEWSTECARCGHTYTFADSDGVVGLTKDELAKRRPGWDIASFSRERVLLSRRIDTWCPEHFILRLDGGELVILRAAEPELCLLTLYKTSAEGYRFPPEEEAKLLRGIAFGSIAELETYAEMHAVRSTLSPHE